VATSGTYAFTLDLSDILEEAYERAGLELRSGYDYRTARRSLDLMFLEWQNRGLNLWTVQEDTQTLTAGTGRYALSSDQLDVIEASLRTDDGDADKQTDLTMSRISISQYSHLTNKLTQGRPIQYWVEKDPGAIALNVWPVPDDAVTYKINYYYIQRVEDTGSPASNNVDIPSRFMPCMAAGLAYYISIKRPEASDRAPLLKQIYDEQWDLAADADRDKSSFFMVPGGYSRV
jgi:hypothetical protein|tara:strand:- start:521 stop:1216 length:696 start_codon:yes stop_codon:yes gene_type:complete